MTQRDRYIDGRAEYLHDFEGYSITEGVEIAKREWAKDHNEEQTNKPRTRGAEHTKTTKHGYKKV